MKDFQEKWFKHMSLKDVNYQKTLNVKRKYIEVKCIDYIDKKKLTQMFEYPKMQ